MLDMGRRLFATTFLAHPIIPIGNHVSLTCILDNGIVARHLRVDTWWLREADSRADVILYYLFVLGVSIIHRRAHPDTWMRWRVPLLLICLGCILPNGRLPAASPCSIHGWPRNQEAAVLKIYDTKERVPGTLSFPEMQ